MRIQKIIVYTLILVVLLIISHWSLAIPIKAQSISLSITPPILEAVLPPGGTITQNYQIENQATETVLKVSIIPFSPIDDEGGVNINQDINDTLKAQINSWFSIVNPSKLKLGSKFPLPRGATQEIILKIAPDKDAVSGDYYFTLLFETENTGFINSFGSSANAKIGSNIILTVTPDGSAPKTAKINRFSAPKLIDSLEDITYEIKIANLGNAFFKPEGEIKVKPTFGKIQTLKIAPLNILAKSEREIPCLKNESVIRCKLQGKVFLGLYKANLSFTIDETGKNYTATATTLAFPFSLTAVIAVIIMISRIIIKLAKKTKKR